MSAALSPLEVFVLSPADVDEIHRRFALECNPPPAKRMPRDAREALDWTKTLVRWQHHGGACECCAPAVEKLLEKRRSKARVKFIRAAGTAERLDVYEHRRKSDEQNALDDARGTSFRREQRATLSVSRRLRFACSFTLAAKLPKGKPDDAGLWMHSPPYVREEPATEPIELGDTTVWAAKHLDGLDARATALLERVGVAMLATFDTGEFNAAEAAKAAKRAAWRFTRDCQIKLARAAQDLENEARRELTKARARLPRLHALLAEREILAHELLEAVLACDLAEVSLTAKRLLSHVEEMRRQFPKPRTWVQIAPKRPKAAARTSDVAEQTVRDVVNQNPRLRQAALRFPDFIAEVSAECFIRRARKAKYAGRDLNTLVKQAAISVSRRLYRTATEDAMERLDNRDFSTELYSILPEMSPSS